MQADLHLHTTFSDGTYSPEVLVSEAVRHGLSAMSVTDHDTMEACPRVAAACVAAGLEFVPGTEITAEFLGVEFHLLAYFFDAANPLLLKEMARFQDVRQNRIREMVTRLQKHGIQIEEQEVFALANCNSPGRPHVARVLIQKGVCKTLEEAFERFLKKNRPAWVPKFRVAGPEAIQLVHQAGGLAVMAHPLLVRADYMIPGLVKAGLNGLECYHTKHTPSVVEHYLAIAAQHDLAVTGGSDCHGMNKGKPLIGSVKLPYENVRLLKERLSSGHPARLNAPASHLAQANS